MVCTEIYTDTQLNVCVCVCVCNTANTVWSYLKGISWIAVVDRMFNLKKLLR